MSKRVLRVENNVLTLTDIIKLNAIAKSEDIIVEIENTKGQDKELIKKFSNNITISILGGLNYVEKDKYNADEYRNRTFYKPRQVSSIIETLESIERNIDPSWNQLEKAMYVYKVFVENFTFNDYPNDNLPYDRNLVVLKTRRGVCAGFSLLFKEEMDRLGIPCEYQNKKHHHSWNVLKFDDKYVPIDITFDISEKQSEYDNKCRFKYFGTNQDFYNDKDHNIFDDSDETVFEITTIPEEVLREAYQHIIKTKHHQSDIKEDIVNNQKVEYSMDEVNGQKICLYRMNNQLFLESYEDGVAKETFFNPNNPRYNETDITLPKFKIYQRDDNTSFCIIKDEERENSYTYCDFNDTDRTYRSYSIYSESNLIHPNNIIEEKTISNKLLKPERLIRKVDHFNGYIGFVRETKMVSDLYMEQQQLNIVNRK